MQLQEAEELKLINRKSLVGNAEVNVVQWRKPTTKLASAANRALKFIKKQTEVEKK